MDKRKCQPIYLCSISHCSTTKAFVIFTNYKGKDKFAIGKFLDHLCENEIPEDESVEKEIIWLDGPSSEFKNNFMRHLMETLSKNHSCGSFLLPCMGKDL